MHKYDDTAHIVLQNNLRIIQITPLAIGLHYKYTVQWSTTVTVH